MSIATTAKQALIAHASPRNQIHPMAIPVAVEQVIKGYLNARRGMSLARVVEGTGRRSTWEVHALTQLGEAGPPKTGRATSPRRSAPAKRTAIRKKRSKK